MAGTAFATGVLAVTATLALGLAAVGGASATAQRSAAAADAAALAAADTASGAVASGDDPCVVAERVAAASGAAMVDCSVDGLVATVQVQAAYAGLAAVARARAGPPEGS
ncbi:helicase [Microbacterium sp. KUDC0406]|uniref:helicase n=1 Tax=Microbacterium sp. KUDC0406 TaxID=2909588 RepID=UPI001F23E48F|nr:helicase [Microbacterium sp. KUDC0406]UJP10393.1 helicase [Microbacterium sp. KUDC0406]